VRSGRPEPHRRLVHNRLMHGERFGSMILEVQEKFATRTLVIALGLSAAFDLALAQQNQPDLTGAISFDVHSTSGRVETLAVTIGDGGTGPYKAILSGDSSLPTHAIYRPRDLRPFGDSNLLPIVAFANGGCRNGSGEFRNFLSDIASHGYIVVAIGPAGEALVGGSEGRVGQTQPSQLLDGVEWAIQHNSLQGSDFYRKIDTSKVAVMGQSCGGSQARSVSGDPRVTTTVMLNSGGVPGTARAATAPKPPAPNPPATNISAALNRAGKRYAPYAPELPDPAGAMAASAGSAAVTFHGPVAFINGGPRDLAYQGALTAFDGIENVPALFAFQDVGHYPATYREPNGGAFAVLVNAWLKWQLKGDPSAAKMFVGASCGFCSDSKWNIRMKNVSK
jgi:hypothetical protein